jgi:8-oxo-dGTP pyrophosphatase MutT (NUDIX family)
MTDVIEPANPWALISEQPTFDCQYFTARSDIVSHAGGRPRRYNHFRMKADGVYVVPIDGDGHTVLVGQHRFVLNRFTWEVPAGGVPRGTPVLDVAKSELSEEAGLRAEHWLQITEAATSPGMTDELSSGFVAWGLRQGEPHPDPEETLTLRRVSFGAAVAMALRGEIANLGSVALILGIETRRALGDLPPVLLDLLA